jgi:hypothetical protein
MTATPDLQNITDKQLFMSAATGIDAVTVGTAGTGYTTVPTVTITGGNPIVPARLTAAIDAGGVSGVTVDHPGFGYQSAPTIGFTGGGGTGAAATAALIAADDADRFKFLCVVSNFTATEGRACSERRVRNCDDPKAAPVRKSAPGAWSGSYNLSGVASPGNPRFRALKMAARNGTLCEFQDKDDLVASAGGGADVFNAYVENWQDDAPETGFVSFSCVLRVDDAKAWTAAA